MPPGATSCREPPTSPTSPAVARPRAARSSGGSWVWGGTTSRGGRAGGNGPNLRSRTTKIGFPLPSCRKSRKSEAAPTPPRLERNAPPRWLPATSNGEASPAPAAPARGSAGGRAGNPAGRASRRGPPTREPPTREPPSALRPRGTVTASEQKRSAAGRAPRSCPRALRPRRSPLPGMEPREGERGTGGSAAPHLPSSSDPGRGERRGEPAARAPELLIPSARLRGRGQQPGRAPGTAGLRPESRRLRGPSAARLRGRGGRPRPPAEHTEVCKAHSRCFQWCKCRQRRRGFSSGIAPGGV